MCHKSKSQQTYTGNGGGILDTLDKIVNHQNRIHADPQSTPALPAPPTSSSSPVSEIQPGETGDDLRRHPSPSVIFAD